MENTTISPQLAAALAQKAKHQDVHYIASPVLGTPPVAAADNLVSLVSGPLAARAKAMPYLIPAVGSPLF